MPKDIKIIEVEHYPDDMTCCTCGCDMKSIKREERMGNFQIVPEHLVLMKHAYHTCACNRGERCKENKPMAAKSPHYIMKGRSIEPGLVVEAVCQKYFEHTRPIGWSGG